MIKFGLINPVKKFEKIKDSIYMNFMIKPKMLKAK